MNRGTRARAVIRVEGRVQGVFFRSAAQKEAERLRISGVAENLPDGSVSIIAEGERSALEAFLQWCSRGPRLASIKSLTVQWQPATGSYVGFTIR